MLRNLRQRKLKRYAFIDQERKNYPLKILCRVMEVSASGYYAWRKRLTKPPCLKRKRLVDLVRNCYFENRRRYGTRRISQALAKAGVMLGRQKVRRLMSEENLKAIQPKAFKPQTTNSKGVAPVHNLLAEINIRECAWAKIIADRARHELKRRSASCRKLKKLIRCGLTILCLTRVCQVGV